MKKMISLLTFLLWGSTIFAQTGKEYRGKAYQSYYSYTNMGVQSIEFLISSPEIIEFLKSNGYHSQYYLMKFKIDNLGNISVSKNLDTTNFSKKIKGAVHNHLEKIEKQFKGIATEFSLYLFNTPYIDIAPDARFEFKNDTAKYVFSIGEGKSLVHHKRFFDKSSARLIKQVIETSTYRIIIYPDYQEFTGKWFCTGWQSMVYNNNNLLTGTGVRFDFLADTRGLMLPSVIKFLTQKNETGEEPVYNELFLYKFKIDYFLKK